MKKNKLARILLLILIPLLSISINVKAEETANEVFNKAVEKFLTNAAGNMYKTDTLAEFSKAQRFESTTYTGLFITNSASSTSLETVSKANYFSKVMDMKKKITYVNTYGSMEYFLNDVKLATSTYFDNSYKYTGINITETYKSSQRILDKRIKNITSFIDAKLKSKGLTDIVRNKVVNKIYTAGYIKLNQSESIADLDTILGLKPASLNPLDDINVKQLESKFLSSVGTILQVKRDEGPYTVEYTYNPNPYSNTTQTKVYDTKKLVLNINTDRLTDLAIQKNAKDLITKNITQVDVVDDLKRIVKNIYGELEIEVYIDSNTYDIRKIEIPEYYITNTVGSSTVQVRFSYIGAEAYTGLKTIKLPTKFITPATIRANMK